MTSNELIDWFLTACIPSRIRPANEWAESEIIVPKGPYRGRPYRTSRLPFSRLLLAEFGKWRNHVVIGPVQSGKSLHAFVFVLLYYLFEVEEDVICGLPDIKMASVKWESDILPVIRNSSYAHLIPESGQGSRGGRPDMITFKNGRSLLFMGGGGNDAQRAGATAKILAITEVDKIDEVAATSKEKQNKIDQLTARVMSEGMSARLFFESTVTDDRSYMWRRYQAGTASRIVCPCVHCGRWVCPEREHFVGWDGVETAAEAGRRAAFSCPECGGLYSEADRRSMNERGILCHKGQEVTPEGDIVGSPPDTDTLGFRWNAFNNLLIETELIGIEEWRAKYGVDGKDEDLDREAEEAKVLQQVWAWPIKSDKTKNTTLTPGMVRGSALGYAGRLTGWPRGHVPEDTIDLVAAIDLGKRVLNWAVYAIRPGRRVHIVDYGFFQTSQPDVVGEEVAVSEGLTALITEIESKYTIDFGLCDSGWLSHVVYPLIQQFPAWRASKGVNNVKYRHPTEPTADIFPSPHGDRWYLSMQSDWGVWLVDFDPDWWKHRVHGSFCVKPIGEHGEIKEGSITIFGSDPEEHRVLSEHITAEVFERKRGFVEGFVKKRTDNHQLDVAVLCFIAESMARADRLLREQLAKETAEPGEAGIGQVRHGLTTPDGRPYLVTER